jgi:glycerol-3-phosphate O-acyltransferase
MLETDLKRQLEVVQRLLHAAPYAPRITVTDLDPLGIIQAGEKLEVVQRGEGGVVQLAPKHAAAMPWYRNNVLHLVAMPSLLACCFQSNERIATADLQRLAWRIYPYIAAELFLRWTEGEVAQVVETQLAAMAQVGLLRTDEGRTHWSAPPVTDPAAMQLSLLAQPTLQTIERYYLAIALLRRAGSGTVTQAELEKRSQQMAERMLKLYGFHSPEFHDRSLFEGFIGLLRRRGVLRADSEGRLVYDEVLDRVADDAQLVLSEQLRHSILQVIHG